jgi:hypothetical protein
MNELELAGVETVTQTVTMLEETWHLVQDLAPDQGMAGRGAAPCLAEGIEQTAVNGVRRRTVDRRWLAMTVRRLRSVVN